MTAPHDRAAESSAGRALDQLLDLFGTESHACDWSRTGATDASGDPAGGLECMVLALDPAQLRGAIVQGDLRAAARMVRGDSPLMLALSEFDGRSVEGDWLVLHGQDGRELVYTVHGPGDRREDGRATADDLAAALGIPPQHTLRWLTLQRVVDEAAPGAPPAAKLEPLARLLSMLKADRADLFAVVAFAVAQGVLLLAIPVAVQALVNFVAQGGALPPLIVVSVLLFGALAFAGVLAVLQAWVVEILQRRLFARTVAHLAARLPRVSVDVYDSKSGPELVNRYFDVMTIQKAGSALLLDGLSILLTVIVGLILLAFYHPLLLAFDFLLLIVIALIVLGPIRKGVRTAIEESAAKYKVAEWLEELARLPHLARSGGTHAWILDNTDRHVARYLERRATHYRVLFGQILSAWALHVIASTALLAIGGLLVIQGSLTLGQLVAAELVVTMVVASFAKMGKQLENYYDMMAATDKIGALLDLPLEPIGGVHGLPASGTHGTTLEVRGLAAGRGNASALFSDLSFHLEPGERLGVSGRSGAGKDVLFDVLWGLRRPTRGSVWVDGNELGSLSLEAARASMSLLTELEMTPGTVRDNVRLGRTFVTESDVRDAVERVGLLEVLEKLPEGLDTPITRHGWPLSDSETRELAAARVIAGRPRLLIVSDELLPNPGAARKKVLDALFADDAPWTLLISSNAPDVLARCPRVLELPHGTMRDGGPPSDTLAA